MVYKTQGLILRKVDLVNASRLFVIYTRDFGKLEISGRGTMKIISKLNGHMHFFSTINLLAARGKQFDKLTGAVIEKNFGNIKNDYNKIILASFAVELTDRLTKTHHPDPELYELLVAFLENLDRTILETKKQFIDLKNYFVVRLMTVLGFQPTQQDLANSKKLNDFLKYHLDRPLRSENMVKTLTLD